MRLWVHTIWRYATDGRALPSGGPKEDQKFESWLHTQDEILAAYAWWLYCNADPKPYNLAPVIHIDEWTSKKGQKMVCEKENTSAITRFPLSAFLFDPTGYIVKANLDYEELMAFPKEQRSKHIKYSMPGFLVAANSVRAKPASLKQKWGAESTDPEGDHQGGE